MDEVRSDRPLARSGTEMLFAASLVACPACGADAPARADLYGSGTSWSVVGTCPGCGAARQTAFRTEGNPLKATVLLRQLGDARPSAILTVTQLAAELDRCVVRCAAPPEELPPKAWRASLAATERALTCALELLKFVPPGEDAIPGAPLADGRSTRVALQAELDGLVALRERYTVDAPRIWAVEAPPPEVIGALDRPALLAHEAWIRAGRAGEGRLRVVGFDARGARLGGAELSGASLERVRLDRAVIDSVRLTDATLFDLSAQEALATSLKLQGARLQGGTFARARLALAVFAGAQVGQTSFESADLQRSVWDGAVVTGARFDGACFANAWLDGGRFVGCSFLGADLRLVTEGIRCTTRGAVFEGCDFTDTRWDGRDLSGATFVGCRFAGASGTPSAVEGLRVEGCEDRPAW